MPNDLKIRVVNVEFLRAGPPHNQLLSPLTQYLAVCNNSSAGVVTVPYEQARFERKLNELRYSGNGGDDLRSVLDEVAEEVAKVLGAVPGLPGALTMDTGQPGAGAMIHLRLTLSASELAMLPFELAKVPVSATQSSESWLGIQTRPPVAITRNVRSVSPEAVAWPKKPRILFISAARDDVPFDLHRKALLGAIEPFRHARYDRHEARDPQTGVWVPAVEGVPYDHERVGRLLTILHNPTLNEIRLAYRADRDAPYTHVHILAHGIEDEQEFGLALKGDGEATDVVSGDRLANALTLVDDAGVHRPAVVTLATCYSAATGTVLVPGTHLAHALHQAGVPLVVASQFPLSKVGSEPLAESLYAGLLWGEHPLILLQQLRSELHARYTADFHDWASLVVYEALPRVLDDQLGELRYLQAKRAVDAALERVDQAVDLDSVPSDGGAALKDRVEEAVRRLPFDGAFAVECIGLRASAGKRLAQAAHTYASKADGNGKGLDIDPYERLEQARNDYELAVRKLLLNDVGAVQRIATVHWVLVQAISLAIVLGKVKRDRTEGAWEAAKLAADFYRDHSDTEQKAWAHASLAELWLLRLADEDLPDADKVRFHDRALEHTRELARLYPSRSAFPIQSTRRQIERYRDWWGSNPFGEGLAQRNGVSRFSWNGTPGLLETAREMLTLLPAPPRAGASATPAAVPPTPEAPPPPPAPPAPTAESGGATPATPAAAAAGQEEQTLGRARRKTSAEGAFFRLEMLPAGHGDCLWIEYGRRGETHRVLVDCGTEGTAKTLLERVEKVPDAERSLELFVMTHVDADHIGGALPFFKAVQRGLDIQEVWFNGWEQISGTLGARQGEMFTSAIKDFRLPLNPQWPNGGTVVTNGGRLPRRTLPGGLTLTLLSPTPTQLQKMAPVWVRELKKNGLEPGSHVDYSQFLARTRINDSEDIDELADTKFESDKAPANGTSIALLAEYEGIALLLGADAYAPVLVAAIRKLLDERGGQRLALDAFKLPHHGSQNNLSQPLLEMVACPRYLFSSNGAHFSHPDREAVARVVKYGGKKPALFFNYQTKFNDLWARADMKEKRPYTARYPDVQDGGLTIELEKAP